MLINKLARACRFSPDQHQSIHDGWRVKISNMLLKTKAKCANRACAQTLPVAHLILSTCLRTSMLDCLSRRGDQHVPLPLPMGHILALCLLCCRTTCRAKSSVTGNHSIRSSILKSKTVSVHLRLRCEFAAPSLLHLLHLLRY